MSIATEPDDAIDTERYKELANLSVEDLIPRMSIVGIAFAIATSVVIVTLTQSLRWPATLSWLSLTSSLPAIAVFGFTSGLAIYRFTQFLLWRSLRTSWADNVTAIVRRRLVAEPSDQTPEGIRDGALRETGSLLHAASLSSSWLIYVGCFVILVLTMPMFVERLQTVAPGESIASTLWLPAVMIVAASFVWLLNASASAIASMGIQRWYSHASLALTPTLAKQPIPEARFQNTGAEPPPMPPNPDENDIFGLGSGDDQPDSPNNIDPHDSTVQEPMVSGHKAYPAPDRWASDDGVAPPPPHRERSFHADPQQDPARRESPRRDRSYADSEPTRRDAGSIEIEEFDSF